MCTSSMDRPIGPDDVIVQKVTLDDLRKEKATKATPILVRAEDVRIEKATHAVPALVRAEDQSD